MGIKVKCLGQGNSTLILMAAQFPVAQKVEAPAVHETVHKSSDQYLGFVHVQFEFLATAVAGRDTVQILSGLCSTSIVCSLSPFPFLSTYV